VAVRAGRGGYTFGDAVGASQCDEVLEQWCVENHRHALVSAGQLVALVRLSVLSLLFSSPPSHC